MRAAPLTGVVASALVAALLPACDATNPDDYKEPGSDTTPCDADLQAPEGYADALKCLEYQSCAFRCANGCDEGDRPYACPAMRGWNAMPHAAACGTFTGDPTDVPVPGKCIATAPERDALARIGLDPTKPGRIHLPDAHWVEPAGREEVLKVDGVDSGFPLNVILPATTRFAVVSDSGVNDNALYIVDLDKLALGQEGIVSHVGFKQPSMLEYGLASMGATVYASGGANGKAYAFTLDVATGAITRNEAADVDLGAGSGDSISKRWYSSGIAVGGTDRLVIAPAAFENALRVATPSLSKVPGAAIDLGASHQVFDVVADPADPQASTFWATALDTREVLRVDAVAAKVTARFPTGKNPEGVAPIAGKWVAVSSSDDDLLDVLDATTGTVVQSIHLDVDGRTGAQPGPMAYDAAHGRLYVTLSGVDAIGAFAVDPSAPVNPLRYLGRVPTAWWPTQVRVRPDGALVVLTGKGHGTGPSALPLKFGDGEITHLTHGSIAVVPMPSDADLVTMDATVASMRRATAAEGWPTVTCPDGAPYDFPVPLTNDGAPSTEITHVIYVVRENKTFDALFGDLPGVDGDPKLVMSPGNMETFWPNGRALAKAFTVFDNYSTSAEQSLQGHIWNAYGRTTDFGERTWTAAWGRDVRQPNSGIDKQVGSAREGSMFIWADKNQIPYDDMGEIVGVSNQGLDPKYPGLITAIDRPDVDKSCYIAARARATCDLKAITYAVMPNDHTQGLRAGAPTPELMIAVNDEATGMLVDAISHSPMWKSTLIVVTEDDPQDGADHVDNHRTPLFMISPWVKRGYVSKTRVDAASLQKIFAHVFAKPYPSQIVAEAPLPFDAFSSTPDYAPYTYAPRKTAPACNPSNTRQADIAATWDFSDPDDQPGLKEQVDEHMRSLKTGQGQTH